MTNTIFTLNGVNYKNNGTETKSANRFYKEIDGKNVRISEAEYDDAFGLWLKQEQDKADAAQAERDLESDRNAEQAVNGKKTIKLEPAILNKNGLVDCRGCKIREDCPHNECMRRNPENVGGLGLCPRLEVNEDDYFAEIGKEIAEQAKAKAKAKRKSKDVAYKCTTGDGTLVLTLTAKQVDFIRHIPDTNFYEHGLDSTPWVDVLVDEIGGQFAGKPMTVGAMISTLREKGLIEVGMDRINGRKAKFFGFTELGKVIAKELGLD